MDEKGVGAKYSFRSRSIAPNMRVASAMRAAKANLAGAAGSTTTVASRGGASPESRAFYSRS